MFRNTCGKKIPTPPEMRYQCDTHWKCSRCLWKEKSASLRSDTIHRSIGARNFLITKQLLLTVVANPNLQTMSQTMNEAVLLCRMHWGLWWKQLMIGFCHAFGACVIAKSSKSIDSNSTDTPLCYIMSNNHLTTTLIMRFSDLQVHSAKAPSESRLHDRFLQLLSSSWDPHETCVTHNDTEQDRWKNKSSTT